MPMTFSSRCCLPLPWRCPRLLWTHRERLAQQRWMAAPDSSERHRGGQCQAQGSNRDIPRPVGSTTRDSGETSAPPPEGRCRTGRWNGRARDLGHRTRSHQRHRQLGFQVLNSCWRDFTNSSCRVGWRRLSRNMSEPQLPVCPLKPRYRIEVRVPAQDRQSMLHGECRNARDIGWNRPPTFLSATRRAA
jgi:hypothetical protein